MLLDLIINNYFFTFYSKSAFFSKNDFFSKILMIAPEKKAQ